MSQGERVSQGDKDGKDGDKEREVARKRWRGKERVRWRDKKAVKKEGDRREREREHHQLEPSILTSESIGVSVIETTADSFIPHPVLR